MIPTNSWKMENRDRITEKDATGCLLKINMLVHLSEPLRGSKYRQLGSLVERTRGRDKNSKIGQSLHTKLLKQQGLFSIQHSQTTILSEENEIRKALCLATGTAWSRRDVHCKSLHPE